MFFTYLDLYIFFPTDTRGLKPIYMEECYWALLFMPLVMLHHLLNVSVQLANKRGLQKYIFLILFIFCSVFISVLVMEPHYSSTTYLSISLIQFKGNVNFLAQCM
jgi:hypothetical protein